MPFDYDRYSSITPIGQIGSQHPDLLAQLPSSQALNALRGKWMGKNNTTNRGPVTSQRSGRGGRPPVLTPEAGPMQQRTSQAAQRHGPARPNMFSREQQMNRYSTISPQGQIGNPNYRRGNDG